MSPVGKRKPTMNRSCLSITFRFESDSEVKVKEGRPTALHRSCPGFGCLLVNACTFVCVW